MRTLPSPGLQGQRLRQLWVSDTSHVTRPGSASSRKSSAEGEPAACPPWALGCRFPELSPCKVKHGGPHELLLIKLPSFPLGVICKLCRSLSYVK